MTGRYPGDAVFEPTSEEQAERAADMAAQRRTELAQHRAEQARIALARHVFFGTQFDPSDDTWSAIKVYRDGNPIILDHGFATEEEADDCAELARNEEIAANSQHGVGA